MFERSAEGMAGGQLSTDLGGTPGGGLAAVLDGADLGGLSDDALLAAMAGCERMVAWAQARQHAVILAFTVRMDHEVAALPAAELGSGPALTGDEVAESEIALALCLSQNGAAHRLHLARDLSRLPSTRAALAAGLIDLAKARAVAEAVATLEHDDALAVEAAVMPRAGAQPVSRLRASLRRAVIRIDPGAAEARHTRALTDRRIEHGPGEDGMGELWLRGPAEGTAAVHHALTHLARGARAADRAHAAATGTTPVEPGMDARRVDALITWARAVLAGDPPAPVPDLTPTPPAPRDTAAPAAADPSPADPAAAGGAGSDGTAARSGVLINVTVSAETLMGISDEPAELAGHGPITAGQARRLAPGSLMRRLLLNPVTGTLLDVGTTTYTPTAALDRHVRARDRTCRAPHCTTPAARCDLDHTTAYPAGPGTCQHNLGCLCRRHHRLKTAGLWNLKQISPGMFRWRTTTGREHTIHPPDLRDQ